MTRYGRLLEVEVVHDYFVNLGSVVREALDDQQRADMNRRYAMKRFLEVLPTQRTARALAGHRMLFKTTGTGFLLGVALDPAAPDSRPAVPPGPDFRVEFGLRVVDPQFHNYTALAGPADAFYHFANEPGNEVAGGLFLSAPVPAHDPARAYEADEIRADTSGPSIDLFRAIRDTGPSPTPVASDWERVPADTFDPAATFTTGAIVLSANLLFRALVDAPGVDLNDAAEWQPLGMLANQYASRADAIGLRPPVFGLDLSSAALAQATVRLFRPGDVNALHETTYAAESGNLGTVQVDLRRLDRGRYRLEVIDGALSVVPSLGFDLYLDPQAVREAWLGVIEISPGTGNMALLDNAGALRSPLYTIRFLNRATRWRYVFPADQPVGTGAEVAPEGASNSILVTDRPRPLTRFGAGVRLQADVSGTPEVSEEVRLPEPETRRIRRQNAQWYSEIHTPNLPI